MEQNVRVLILFWLYVSWHCKCKCTQSIHALTCRCQAQSARFTVDNCCFINNLKFKFYLTLNKKTLESPPKHCTNQSSQKDVFQQNVIIWLLGSQFLYGATLLRIGTFLGNSGTFHFLTNKCTNDSFRWIHHAESRIYKKQAHTCFWIKGDGGFEACLPGAIRCWHTQTVGKVGKTGASNINQSWQKHPLW